MKKSCSSTEQTNCQHEYIESEKAIILWIPNNTIKLDMRATIYSSDDEIHKAERVLDMKDIEEARRDYLSLDPDDMAFATFSLTSEAEEALKYAETYNVPYDVAWKTLHA